MRFINATPFVLAQHGGVYYEVLFTHEHPFEELCASVLVLFARTWKEMRALYPDDMSTVIVSVLWILA